ncbi:MAG: hypothetical protein QNK31_03400 [Porticoccus sp.]|nr:hypothetical protein [Porticoccus sp.]
MVSPTSEANKNLNDRINNSETAKDTASTNGSLLESISALWLALANHLDAITNGVRLDIKLAASSLMALLVTGIFVAALLLGLWFLAMVLLFLGLTTFQVPAVVALLVIVLIQFLLLYFCHNLSQRLLTNLSFKATRAALPETPNFQETL